MFAFASSLVCMTRNPRRFYGPEPGDGDVKALTELLGHEPRRHEDFARETALG